MENIVNLYVSEIENKEEYKKLKELKLLIDKEYAALIIALKNKEAKYLEAKERPNIFDLEQAQKEFVIAKTNLYSKPLVKEYFMLEEQLNAILKDDMEELSSSISTHFKKSLL